MHNRPGRSLARINLIWVIGVAAGVLAGGVVAYSVTSSSPEISISR